jgi:hypothetical protein
LKIRESFSKRIEGEPFSGLVTSHLIHLKKCPETDYCKNFSTGE